MPRVLSSSLSAALAGLLALAAWTQELWLVAAAVVLVQAMIAGAPNAAEARQVASPRFVAVLLGGVVATGVALDPSVLAGSPEAVAGRDALLSSGVLAGILPGSAVAVVGVLLGQMLRRDGREGLVGSAGRAVMLGVLACLASGWVAASRTTLSIEVVLVAAAAVAAAVLVWLLPGDRVVVASAAVVAGALAGAAVPLLLDGLATWVLGVAVGGMAAACALLGQVVGRIWSTGRLEAADAWGLPGALGVALVGPVVHVGAQLATLTF